MNSERCWCGRPDQHDELTALGHGLIETLRIPELVRWTDRQMRRWPWFYRSLSK